MHAAIPSSDIDRERARIARELHDGLAADLVALTCRARRLAGEAEDDTVKGELGMFAERVQNSLRELRQVVWALRSPDRPWGLLVEVLRERVEGLSTDETLVELVNGKAPVGRVDGETALHLIRCAQEAVLNAVRHARAKRVTVRLTEVHGCVRLEIADDGMGIRQPQMASEGGLVNLSRRAEEMGGDLRLTTGPTGTRIQLDVPH
jgi:signal transduction histidine kinase